MKLFKNQNRGKNTHSNVEPFVPEYVRLNREPEKVSFSREEFRRPAPKFSAPVPNNSVPIPTSVAKSKYYDESLASTAVDDFSQNSIQYVKANDIELPKEINGKNEVDEENLDFSSLNVGDYVIIYDNSILATGCLEDLTNLLEDILTSDEYKVDIDKLSVMKKMSFRTGVLIGD